MTETQQGLIVLLKSAVTERSYPLPEKCSLEDMEDIIRKQSLTQLVFQGAYHCGLAQTAWMQQHRKTFIAGMIRSECQLRDLERIFRIFEENQISYMPVKGCEMKKIYPRPELRVMGDADILIRTEQHETIRPLLEAAGFAFGEENAHVFVWKSKDLYVELHKSLVPPSDGDYYDYYGTGWQFARHQSGYRYAMSAEDAFVFLFTHFARHYRFSGIGCRHVVDLYVYRRTYPHLDQDYLRRELEKLSLLAFYDNTMRLLDVWFEGGEETEITELMTAFIFSGGNWGSETIRSYHEAVKNRQRHRGKWDKIRAAIRAVFPPCEQIQYTYPVLKAHPALLPLIWVIRWFDILLIRRYVIRRKLAAGRTAADEKVNDYEKALEMVGLEFAPEEGRKVG